MPRFLHVANGTSTTQTIEAAGIPGRCSIWADPLYEGPVPAALSDAELMDVRARYLRDAGPPLPGQPSLDPLNDLRQWRAAIERDDSYDELILWYEHDLFDQLNLVQLLSWIREHPRLVKRVSLVCIGSFPGRPHFKGLGELTPTELESLLPTRQAVADAQFDLAQRAWDAFRQPTPEALDDLRRRDTTALPYLREALTRFLQEYPWTGDGLSRSERRLLELAKADGISLRDAFPHMHDGERAYYITDLSLAALAGGLAGSTPPLLELDRPSHADADPLHATVRLTDAGRAVLKGGLDRIAACGIDRWLGGVHLHAGAASWRWDDARQRITRGPRP